MPPPGDFPNPGIKPRSPALQTESLLGAIQQVNFLEWLCSLRNMHSCLHVFSWFDISFLFGVNYILFSQKIECQFIDSPTEEHLGCFYILVIMNKASINISVQVSVLTYFSLFWINAKEFGCQVI